MIAHVHEHLLMIYLNDNTRARILLPDGSYRRAHPEDGATPIDSQALFALDRANRHRIPPGTHILQYRPKINDSITTQDRYFIADHDALDRRCPTESAASRILEPVR